MITKYRVNHHDVTKMVSLRDDEKCSWEVISMILGYDLTTCRIHYNLSKSGVEVLYFSKFLEELRKLPIEKTTCKEAFELCVSMGHEGAYSTFSKRADIKRLPLKGSLALKRKRINKVLKRALKEPNKSLRDLVWEVFSDYSYNAKYHVLQELSEINYE